MTEEMLEKSVFLVEANSYEQLSLWCQFSPESDTPRFPVQSWISESQGRGVRVGKLAGMPVCISLSWAKINGQWVTFYYATSQVVDYRLVEKWLETHFNKTYNGGRRARSDAMNFGHCLQAIEERNKEEI